MPLTAWSREAFCYLTTTGRSTGRPHTVQMWFAVDEARLFVLSGARDRSDWVKNLLRNPEVTVRLAGRTWRGRARFVEGDEHDALARRLVFEKYRVDFGDDLIEWRDTSLPIRIDLELPD